VAIYINYLKKRNIYSKKCKDMKYSSKQLHSTDLRKNANTTIIYLIYKI